jgi:hypothetical protein
MYLTIRRILAVALIPLFFVLFLGTLLTFRVNATLLEPSFYTNTLAELDAYNFIYDEGIPYALEEAEQERGLTLSDVPFGLDLTVDEVSILAKEILPPEWVEENVGHVINAGVPYLTGAMDELDVQVPVDDRLLAAAGVTKELVAEADLHSYLINDIVREGLGEQDFLDDLPFGLTLTEQQIIDGVAQVIPKDWLKAQAVALIDDVMPYLLGRTDEFNVHVPLQARTEAALEVVEEWLLTTTGEGGGAYEYLLEEQIAPVRC